MSNYSDNTVANDPNHVWSKLANLIPDKSEVLDIGCSSGNLGRFLIEEKGCKVDGVEPDEADAKIASKYFGKVWAFSIEDEKNIEQIKKKYDILIFADVLEHLVNPSSVLVMVKKLLKPNGRVVFSLPNMGHVSVRLSLLGGDFDYTETGLLDKTHLHFYDLSEVQNMFKRADMKIETFDSSSFPYSTELLTARLKQLGLTADKKGLELLQSKEASTFQFVGSVSYDKSAKHVALKPTTPALAKDVAHLSDVIAEKVTEIQQKDAIIKNFQHDVAELTEKIQELTSSKAYKLGNIIVTPYRKVHNRINHEK